LCLGNEFPLTSPEGPIGAAVIGKFNLPLSSIGLIEGANVRVQISII